MCELEEQKCKSDDVSRLPALPMELIGLTLSCLFTHSNKADWALQLLTLLSYQ
jgi:hypothetical protein